MINAAAARISHSLPAVLVGAVAVLSTMFFHADRAHATSVTVIAGRALVTSVPGFAPGTAVERRLDGVVLSGPSHADRAGVFRVRLKAPSAPGRHRLLLIGLVESGSTTAGDPVDPATDVVDRQSVVAEVPRLVPVDFRVVDGDGDSDGAGTGSGAGNRTGADGDTRHGGGQGTADQSGTADTGSNVLRPALVGAALVVLGAILTGVARSSTRSVR